MDRIFSESITSMLFTFRDFSNWLVTGLIELVSGFAKSIWKILDTLSTNIAEVGATLWMQFVPTGRLKAKWNEFLKWLKDKVKALNPFSGIFNRLKKSNSDYKKNTETTEGFINRINPFKNHRINNVANALAPVLNRNNNSSKQFNTNNNSRQFNTKNITTITINAPTGNQTDSSFLDNVKKVITDTLDTRDEKTFMDIAANNPVFEG